MADVCLALVIAGVTAYAVLGGADFGGGLWDLTAGGAKRGGRVRGMVQRSMSPVWEANHVWLIFVLVIFWTCFPVAFGAIFSSLYVPLFLATIGIIFRGTAFALRGEAATINEARVLGGLFALSSVLVPFCLGAAVGGVASGRIEVGNALGDPVSSWLNPTGILVGTLAVLTGAYLAAVFMAGDSARGELADLEKAFRSRALASGAITGALAIGGLVILRHDARHLYDGLTTSPGIFLVLGSAFSGLLTMILVWRRSFETARYAAAAAVGCVTVGWAVAQSPDLLPGRLTIDQASAGNATLVAVLISVAVGLVLLVPSLYLLYSLVLKGRLDEDFEPLDQRFRPLSASDSEAKET